MKKEMIYKNSWRDFVSLDRLYSATIFSFLRKLEFGARTLFLVGHLCSVSRPAVTGVPDQCSVLSMTTGVQDLHFIFLQGVRRTYTFWVTVFFYNTWRLTTRFHNL